MASAWLETLRNSQKTCLIQDGMFLRDIENVRQYVTTQRGNIYTKIVKERILQPV